MVGGRSVSHILFPFGLVRRLGLGLLESYQGQKAAGQLLQLYLVSSLQSVESLLAPPGHL